MDTIRVFFPCPSMSVLYVLPDGGEVPALVHGCNDARNLNLTIFTKLGSYYVEDVREENEEFTRGVWKFPVYIAILRPETLESLMRLHDDRQELPYKHVLPPSFPDDGQDHNNIVQCDSADNVEAVKQFLESK